MGVEYTLYTEIYVKDKWYGIDSYVLTPMGEYKLSPLLSGKSYVRELLNKLDFCKRISFSELAESTQKYLIAQTDEEYRN